MVHLRTRYHNFGIFCKALERKTLESFRGIRFLPMYVVRPFGIVCGHLVYFSPFWYIAPRKIWQPLNCDGVC
jgi:hypothetical protein